MLTIMQIAAMLQKEYDYSAGWGKGDRKVSKVPGVPDHLVNSLPPIEGQPFSIPDLMCFARKYLDEADQTIAHFTPDGGATRIRILKAVSLLVSALRIHGRTSDLKRLAGASCSEFPILPSGLKGFEDNSNEEGCLIQTPKTRGLRSESPGCDSLKK